MDVSSHTDLEPAEPCNRTSTEVVSTTSHDPAPLGLTALPQPRFNPPVPANAFFTDEGKQRITQCVSAIEADTRAEIVVAVRPRIPGLEAYDFWVAGAVAYAGLLALLYLPMPFSLWVFAVGIPALFVSARMLMQISAGLRRLVVPAAKRRACALEAARATFHSLNVRETRERNGMLVLVSPAEHTVVVVPDRGLKRVLTEEDITTAERCLEGEASLDRLLAALGELGTRLAGEHPRGDKTDNELEEVA